MAASSGVRWATLLVAASTFFCNAATVAEERAASPRPLPARERKLRRVRVCTRLFKAFPPPPCNRDLGGRRGQARDFPTRRPPGRNARIATPRRALTIGGASTQRKSTYEQRNRSA